MKRSSSVAAAVLVILCGAGLRVPGLADPPLDFHATRQYRSAIMARGYVLDLLRDWDPAARSAAETAARSQGQIEPPIMEHLASWVYRGIGREDLAWARALAVVAWTLGGLAMFWLAIQVVAAPAAVAAVAAWTFTPFAIRASQSFQPDPLMTALVVLSLAAAVSYGRRRTTAAAVLFGCAFGAALFVKAVAIFFLGPALVALVLLGPASTREKAATAAVAIVAALPAVWYYSMMPAGTDYGPFWQLLGGAGWWRDWGAIVHRVVSAPLMLAALAGTLVAVGELRRLLVALLAGYFVFGLVFTHHIHTHDYYSLPLVPIVALGVGALVDWIGRTVPAMARSAVPAGVCLACMAWAGLAVVDSRRSERIAALKLTAVRYEQIGRLVGHSASVLSLDGDYGLPLNYHGRMVTANVPLIGDLAVLALRGRSAEPAATQLRSSGAQFFVATVQAELEAQPDLKAALQRQYPLIRRDGGAERWAVLVYDLQRGILSATPANLSIFSRVGEPSGREESVSLYAPAATRWTVQPPEDGSVRVAPAEGTGPATLRVTVPAPTAPVDRTATVTVNSVTNGSTSIEVRIRAVAGANNPPFGFVDAPSDPITLGDAAVVLQGWALDDTSMQRVWVGYLDVSGRVVAIGDARREGYRADVAKAFPTSHDHYKAAWAFTLTPIAVRGIPRPLQLQIFAEDGGGLRAQIGGRTVR